LSAISKKNPPARFFRLLEDSTTSTIVYPKEEEGKNKRKTISLKWGITPVPRCPNV
jgi:hypothetical protein